MKTGTLEDISTSNLTGPLRALILEDSHDDVDLILSKLKEADLHFDYTLVQGRQQFRRALQSGEFEVILADFRLPGWTGMDAFRELRASGRDIPFLLVTGTLGEEAAVECIKAGVSEYVLKDRLSRLPAALKRAMHEKTLREENAQAQRALAENEARTRQQFAELENIYRTAPIGLAVYGPDLRYIRVNEELARINGFLPEEHAGRLTRELNPDVAEIVEPHLKRVFARGESIQNVEARGTTRAHPGVMRDWLVNFHPLRTSDGTIFGASVVVLEITERKRAIESLRLSEARNQDLVEQSAYGIFRATPDGSFLDANPALRTMLGFVPAADLHAVNLGHDIFRFPEHWGQLIAECGEKDRVHGAESEWRRRDGSLVAVRLAVRRVSIPSHPDEIEVIAEDVTELRAVERQLRQAQKFEAIGQLASGVAHDFNNVIGAILGWAELGLEQNKGNPRVEDRFSRIREQSERAATLTRELLDFGRRQVLQPKAVDLNTVTNNLVSFLEKVIGRNIEFKVITSPLDAVKADPTQIEQVLMNLCLNARDAMPNGGRLIVETEMVEIDESYGRFYPQVTPGRYTVLSVSDTGTGMNSETRERLFEPFFTTKERGKGTGMGLAIVYSIARQHGGFIHVYSEPGQGSLFRFYLPALAGAFAQDAPAKAPVPSLAEMRGSETILIADDHESIREMSRQALLSLGYRVLSACDGEEALRICQTEAPALAILDVVMPKLGGPSTASKLAARFDQLPILFTSGYSRDSENVAPVVADAHYLQKPYSPTTLGRLVREILDQAATSREAHGMPSVHESKKAR